MNFWMAELIVLVSLLTVTDTAFCAVNAVTERPVIPELESVMVLDWLTNGLPLLTV